MNRLFALFLVAMMLLSTSCSRPRRFETAAVVIYRPADQSRAEDDLRVLLPKDDPSVKLRRNPSSTSMYEVVVTDENPLKAAERASLCAVSMRQHFAIESREDGIFQVVKAAVPANR